MGTGLIISPFLDGELMQSRPREFVIMGKSVNGPLSKTWPQLSLPPSPAFPCGDSFSFPSF